MRIQILNRNISWKLKYVCIFRSITSKEASSALKYTVSGLLGVQVSPKKYYASCLKTEWLKINNFCAYFQASDIHQPYPGAHPPGEGIPGGDGFGGTGGRTGGTGDPGAEPIKHAGGPGGSAGSSFSGLPGALIGFGCIVFAAALAAMVYLCFVRKRYKNTSICGKSVII